MAIKRVNKEQEVEQTLEQQIGDLGAVSQDNAGDIDVSHIPDEPIEAPSKTIVGTKLSHWDSRISDSNQEAMRRLDEEKHLSRIGERIGDNAELRDGWLTVDRALLGERSKYYPEDWEFRIRPATVEVIRNWSTIDENSPNSIDTVFDEILKSCLAIRTANGPLPWSQIYTWDRFFFVLLCREYTFQKGEAKVQFTRECPNCGVDVTFTLDSQSLMYDMPDDELFDMYDVANRCWHIFPADYDVRWKDEEVTLYMPTREKDNAVRDYIFNKAQQDRNAKIDRVFFKFLPWMLPKISKDANLAASQIRKAEMEYKSWDMDMFSFMDDVINNITITPSMNMIAQCQSCGEEATAPIQFPDGISSLFAMAGRHKKFGKK